MRHARKIRAAGATAGAIAVLAVPLAVARRRRRDRPDRGDPGSDAGRTGDELRAGAAEAGRPTLAPPAAKAPAAPVSGGGRRRAQRRRRRRRRSQRSTAGAEGAPPAPTPSTALAIPSLPTSSCAATGVPPILIPIYQRAAAAYGLGPQGPAVLAGINEVETAFGTNLNPSSAGASGWMQFMPATWADYGVDANGDGVNDPYNPEDAIFAAASYLSAAGMPADTYGAIFAYNHADWYVSEVLANAGCYAARSRRRRPSPTPASARRSRC